MNEQGFIPGVHVIEVGVDQKRRKFMAIRAPPEIGHETFQLRAAAKPSRLKIFKPNHGRN